MAVSLYDIHQALNDFFLTTFGTGSGAPIIFRFDKNGSAVSDEDFVDPRYPERGYSPAIAVEKFSDIVNRVPRDLGDSVNIVMSQDAIDDTYFYRMLSPATPFVADGTEPGRQQEIIDSFSRMKADGLGRWNNATLESSSGMMLRYKPSQATPTAWYDITDNDVWTSRSFPVSSSSGSQSDARADQLWRIAPADRALAGDAAPDTVLRPVDVDTVSISFDYCAVGVRRLWLSSVLLNENGWYVPRLARGQLTNPGVPGGLPLMPISFVAIRSLSIRAPWSEADVANAVTATGFGPFRVTPGITGGSLSHRGIQVIGWLLQAMPPLPPHDPPPEPPYRGRITLTANSSVNLDPERSSDPDLHFWEEDGVTVINNATPGNWTRYIGRPENLTREACTTFGTPTTQHWGIDSLRKGDVLCFQTSEGRISGVRIEEDPASHPSELPVTFITWPQA